MPEVGLILTDLSLKPIALNREAAAILSYPDRPDAGRRIISGVARELLERIRRHESTDMLSLVTSFRLGREEYICRAYFMKSYEGVAQSIIALLLERTYPDSEDAIFQVAARFSLTEREPETLTNPDDDAISQVAARFNLTEREREALKWTSLGLTNKEIAKRMNISPNTVKSFLRLSMVKVGVTTRTAMVAKILAHNKRDIRVPA